jgi:hypothetical protein
MCQLLTPHCYPFFLFNLLWPLTVLMKQIRQQYVPLSSLYYLDVYGFGAVYEIELHSATAAPPKGLKQNKSVTKFFGDDV